MEVCNSEIAVLKKEVQDLKTKMSNQASFTVAATTGIELVEMERELNSTWAGNIKLEAYT